MRRSWVRYWQLKKYFAVRPGRVRGDLLPVKKFLARHQPTGCTADTAAYEFQGWPDGQTEAERWHRGFKGSDVGCQPERPAYTPLIDRWGAGCVAGVNGRTAREQGHCERRTTIGSERSEF